MSDFFNWLFFRESLFWIIGMAILFWVALIFLARKLYKLALLFALFFFISFAIIASGPMGERFRERISGKREPTFKMLDKKQVDQLREKIRRDREESL